MSYSLDQYTYGQKLRFYNSERRENVGTNAYVIKADGDYYVENVGATLQKFTIDCTSLPFAEPRTVCSFANGVTIRYEANNYVDPGLSSATFNCQLTFRMYDKDGDPINELSDYTLQANFNKQYCNATNAFFYYSPPHFGYDLRSSSSPSSYSGGGAVFTPSRKADNYHSFTPINIVNENLKLDKFHYSWDVSSIMLYTGEFDNFMDIIIGNGDDTPITPTLPEDDTSGPGGGTGGDPDYNPYSDEIDFPGLPTGGSAIASGFIRVYNPTAPQLQSVADKLWGNDFVTTVKKIMNDPMEAMISLHSVPFGLATGSNANILVGNFNTEVPAKVVTTQYYTLDCGNISVPEHWASALDYSPYTNIDIFIPFVGVRPLQIDDVMGRVLNLKYNIDVLTGSAIAMLKCGDSVLYTYNTQVHTEIPYTMSSFGRLLQSIVGVAGTAIGATAGGAGAIIGGAMGGALGTAMTKHSDISRGGALGGTVGVMGDFVPYLIIHRPIQSLAGDFASKKGYPSNISATLESVSGYTVVDKIHLTGIDCTDTERDEIHALLKDGVII